MNLLQLIFNVKKTPERESRILGCYYNSFLKEVQLSEGYIDLYSEDIPYLKAYFTDVNWLCTDDVVGIRAYYFQDELVAISSQPGRKYGEEFEWVSKEAYQKVRQYVADAIAKKEPDIEPKLIDFDFDMSSYQSRIDNPYIK